MSTYSIRPWGKAAIIGQSPAAYAVGIGMRWRETLVQLTERRTSPDFELSLYRRSVLSKNGVQMLVDLGVTRKAIESVLRPAGKWLFVNNELTPLRDGDQYPGCAPNEAVYHATEGEITRMLRREFLRFGGYITWGTEAHEVYPVGDDEGLWNMNRDYGKSHDLEAIVCAARHAGAIDALYGQEEIDAIPFLRFNMVTGYAKEAPQVICDIFGKDYDFIVALGRGFVMHMYRPWPKQTLVSWRVTQPPGTPPIDESIAVTGNRDDMHPALRRLMAVSSMVLHDEVRLPGRPAVVQDDARLARVTIIGDALYPVDPFELRGDRHLVGIEDASALVRRLYSQRFHRGFTPVDFREHEMEALAKRAQLLQRDLYDVQTFLESMREIGADRDATGAAKPKIEPKEEEDGKSHPSAASAA